MKCPSQLACSMYADGALPADEAAPLERHLEACPKCRALVSGLVQERRVLETALQQQDAHDPIPEFRGAASRSGLLAAAAAVIGLASSSLALGGLFDAVRLPAPLAWLNPLSPTGLIDAVFGVFLFLATEGRSMIASTVETTGAMVLFALLASVAFAALRKRPGTAAAAFSIALVGVVLASPAQALEIRRSEQIVSVPAGETVDDTVIAMGQSVEIDGIVTGDLIAFAQRVVIRGAVQGQLITGAQTVSIEGELGGSVLGFAQSLELEDVEVAGNLFGFAQDVVTRGTASVGGNAVLFASRASIGGPVEKDVLGFAGEVEISDTVGGDVTAYSGAVRLLAPARIGGDVVAHVRNEDDLQVSPSATVGGSVRTEIDERRLREPDRELITWGFYASQAVRLAAAFLTGLIVLWLVPSLRRLSLDTAGEAVTAAGIGLVTLVAVPIIAVMTAITLIGLPIAVLAVLLWLAGLYFAKILLAHFVGKMLLERVERPPQLALALLIGLLIVLILINIPFLGGLLNFVMTITGLGMLVVYIWGRFQGRSFEDGDAGRI